MAVVDFATARRGPDGGAVPEPAEARRKVVETPAGRRLSYIEAGSGPDVLLLHGMLTTLDDMRLSVFDILGKDFHVVAMDRPSRGESDRVRSSDASLWTQAETIHDAARVLGLARPVVCGHSYGGAVALAYAMAFPGETAGVVALAPVCFPEARLEHLLFGPRAAPVVGEAVSHALAASTDELLLPTLWRAMFLPQAMPPRFAVRFPFPLAGRPEQSTAEGEGANAIVSDLARSALQYGTCRTPVRFLAGTADIVVNPYLHSVMAAAIMPAARIALLPGLGHMLHHFRPDAVAEAIRDVARASGVLT